jgi:hypothetical protein
MTSSNTSFLVESSSNFPSKFPSNSRAHLFSSQDQVLFEFQGAPLLPSKSPAECGWQSAFGTLEIEARPVGGDGDGMFAGKSGVKT